MIRTAASRSTRFPPTTQERCESTYFTLNTTFWYWSTNAPPAAPCAPDVSGGVAVCGCACVCVPLHASDDGVVCAGVLPVVPAGFAGATAGDGVMGADRG